MFSVSKVAGVDAPPNKELDLYQAEIQTITKRIYFSEKSHNPEEDNSKI
jgi:hypothetical protein